MPQSRHGFCDFASLRKRGAQVVLPYFHWGIESENRPYDVQTELALVDRHQFDNGVVYLRYRVAE